MKSFSVTFASTLLAWQRRQSTCSYAKKWRNAIWLFQSPIGCFIQLNAEIRLLHNWRIHMSLFSIAVSKSPSWITALFEWRFGWSIYPNNWSWWRRECFRRDVVWSEGCLQVCAYFRSNVLNTIHWLNEWVAQTFERVNTVQWHAEWLSGPILRAL